MRDLSQILDGLEQHLGDATRGKLGTSGEQAFKATIAAALAKNLEFSKFAHSEAGDVAPFFATGTLRGICEDLIVLKFIMSLESEDRSLLVNNLFMKEVTKSAEAQANFFGEGRPSQPVLDPSPFQEAGQRSSQKLTSLKKKYGWGGRGIMPSTYKMACEVQLKNLYQYLYHATSEWVHFKTRILLRMGWEEHNDPDEEWDFTTYNYKSYYSKFNKFYSVYLLIKFVDTFSDHLNLGYDADARIDELREYIDELLRWPELVTFEEMNLEGPSQIIRILLHVSRDNVASDSD